MSTGGTSAVDLRKENDSLKVVAKIHCSYRKSELKFRFLGADKGFGN